MVSGIPADGRRLAFPSPMSGNSSRLLFQHKVLGRYKADYYYDEKVGYIFVRQPHWLEEAYTEAISSLDTGILARNLSNIDILSRCLSKNSHHGVTNGIDLGAGYGLLVRGMRDVGVDFYWSDKYSQNLMARGFEAKSRNYDIAVAFEVLEHLPNPLEFLRECRKEYQFHTCFFSAICFDEQKLPETDWWYWTFESGQHISFFSKRSLLWMAEQLEMRLWPIKWDVFAFSNLRWAKVDSLLGKLGRWVRNRAYRLSSPGHRRKSLTEADHIKLRNKVRASTDDRS